jgi:hypothetical protein
MKLNKPRPTIGRAYEQMMRLASIPRTPERENVAVTYLEQVLEPSYLDLEPTKDKNGYWIVSVCDRNGNNTEYASFTTKKQATNFIDLLILISELQLPNK